MSEAFVQLMRTYCIDYTNSHDLSVCDAIMDPDYVVYITGMSLGRDSAYKPSVAQVFERFPNLGLAVHEFVTNGDRLAMRFSEHAADTSGGLACWPGIGLYDWNGSQLTTCRVEQDFWSQQRQLDSGVPDALEPPHLDPWTTTTASPSQRAAEQVAREWLVAGDLSRARTGRIDDSAPADYAPVVKATATAIHDLFSAGDRVAFHASLAGTYCGGLSADVAGSEGHAARIDVAGILRITGGEVDDARLVTDRFGTWLRLLSGDAAT
jgi:hypothetical protein